MSHSRARLLATLVGTALGFVALGHQNLWVDEVMSLTAARASWGGLIRFFYALPEQHPLYYLLLRGWLVFGESEAALRSLSAICFGLTVPVIGALGQAAATRRVGTAAAWLAATSPFLLYYGQEARMYALLGLLSAGATLALVRWLETEERKWLAGYGVIGVLGCYTHFFFAFLIVGHFVAALVARGWRARSVRALFGVQALVAVTYLPWAILLARHFGEPQVWKNSAYIVFGLPYTLLRFAVGYSIVPANYEWRAQLGHLAAADAPALLLAGAGFAASFVTGGIRLWRGGGIARIPLLVMMVPVGLGLLFSVITILVGDRYFMVIYPVFLVIVAGGVVRLAEFGGPMRWAGWAAIAALGASSVLSLEKYYRSAEYGKEQWEEAAQTVRTNQQPGDLVVVHRYFAADAFRYYYRPGAGERVIPNDDPSSLPPSHRIWLVLSHTPNEPGYLARILPGRRVTFDRRYTHETGIRVMRLESESNPTRAR